MWEESLGGTPGNHRSPAPQAADPAAEPLPVRGLRGFRVSGDVPTLGCMSEAERQKLLVHLELQARTLAAQAALAQLDDSKTDSLLPEIRDQLVVMSQTLDTLGV